MVLAVRYGMFVALLLWIAAMAFVSEHFLSATNLLNVARQAAPIIVIGVGMTFVMATGGIDLSVGSVVALVSCLPRPGWRSGCRSGPCCRCCWRSAPA